MTTRATRSPRRRTVVALAVVLAVLVAFVIRLVDIQIVNASQHMADARSKGMETTSTLKGTRGDIVDANGVTLASSTLLYDAKIDPMLAIEGINDRDAEGALVRDENGDPVRITWDELAVRIAEVTEEDVEEVRAIVNDAIAADPADRFEYLGRYLTTAEFRALADLELPFVSFEAHPART